MSDINSRYSSEINKLFTVLYGVLEGKKHYHADVKETAKELYAVVLRNLVGSPDHNEILNAVIARYETEVGIQTFDPDFVDAQRESQYWLHKIKDSIHTPATHTHGAVQGEHPYAGYLALGVAHLYAGECVGSSVEFQLGTTGHPALADEAQDLIHKTCGLERWGGWEEQIPSEVTFQLTARQDYRLPWFEISTPGGWQTDATFFTREVMLFLNGITMI